MEERKLERRGRYNEVGKEGKDVYHLSQKAKEHIAKIQKQKENR